MFFNFVTLGVSSANRSIFLGSLKQVEDLYFQNTVSSVLLHIHEGSVPERFLDLFICVHNISASFLKGQYLR